MRAIRALWVVGLIVFAGCGGGELEGPERSRFELVDMVELEVERGAVQIFGSSDQKGAVVDRWMGPRESFRQIDEFLEFRRLVVQAHCRSRGGCDVRYDFGLARTARAQVELEEGELRFVKYGGPIKARVKKGRLTAQRLSSSEVSVEVGEGRAQLEFEEAPERLHLRIEQGEAAIFVPDRSYRCEFDRESSSIRLNGLRCHQSSLRTIEVEHGGGKVRFGLRDVPE